MSVKGSLVNVIRHYPPLFRFSSRVYQKLHGGFRSLSPGTLSALDTAFETAQAARFGDVGDYYEFGLFRGRTFLHAWETCRRLGIGDTNFYGFDSFQGLPAVEGVDADGRFFEGQFAAGRDEVERNLRRHGMDMSRVRLIEGFFEDSLTPQLKASLPRRRAGVVLLDCDLYSSTIEAMRWLEDMLVDGALVLFDDWSSYGDSNELGQQRALGEFLDVFPRWGAEPLWNFDRHGKAYRFHLRHS